jgi:hypothetical protein
VKSGTPADFNKAIAEGMAVSASTRGRVQAAEVVAENEIRFSKPVRTGGVETGIESEEGEDSSRQQSVPPQSQQMQLRACASAVGAGPENAAGAQASNRLNRMASSLFTG